MYSRFSGACILINFFLSDPTTYRAPGVKYEKENGSRVRCWYICWRNSEGGWFSKAKQCVWARRLQGAASAPLLLQPWFRDCKAEQMRVMKDLIPLPCLSFAANHTPPPNPNKSTWRLKIGDERLETDADRSVTLGALGNQVVWMGSTAVRIQHVYSFPSRQDTIPNQPC